MRRSEIICRRVVEHLCRRTLSRALDAWRVRTGLFPLCLCVYVSVPAAFLADGLQIRAQARSHTHTLSLMHDCSPSSSLSLYIFAGVFEHQEMVLNKVILHWNNLAKARQYHALEERYNRCAPCPGIIAGLLSELYALRRQIKETKDAIELDDLQFQDITAKVQAETADRQNHLELHVKLAAAPPTEAKGGRVTLGAGAHPQGGALPVPTASGGKTGLEFGAIDEDGDGVLSKEELQRQLCRMRWSLEEAEKTFKAMDRGGDGGISSNEYAAVCQIEDKNLQLGTLNGIAILRQPLANLQAKLAAFASKDASKDVEIQDLKKRLAATEKQLAEEKRKEEELETKVCAEDE
jgi:hypothetical protein